MYYFALTMDLICGSRNFRNRASCRGTSDSTDHSLASIVASEPGIVTILTNSDDARENFHGEKREETEF